MTRKEFHKYAKKINRYRLLKKLTGKLSYAPIGDSFNSDILYERGYNMIELVEQGVLELVPDVFDFEKDIVGKNVHSVHTRCPDCQSWGINGPLEKKCGNCGYHKGITYYDAETIDLYLKKIKQQ